jgi:chorismate mutase
MVDKLHIKPIKEWLDNGLNKPLIIAGPCSAETEEQVMETARQIKANTNSSVLRSGIWKPRTRPGSFEGVGEIGLRWLKSASKETGLKTIVEVAYPQHVEAALKHEVDMVWIGARTAANPFSVQEIANAIEGANIPVLIKNPVNPDLDLWIGAIERIYKSGIDQIAAIHRGFYPFEKTKLRNIPKWELVIELKRQIPDLPLICDPSHISGSVEYIQEIAQKALDLNLDGLMIETHRDPKNAKSDAKQQITPLELSAVLNSLNFRQSSVDDSEFLNKLEQFRQQIDSIDYQLLELLSQRMEIVGEIGKYKCENNVTILQLRRWENIIKTRSQTGIKLDLNPEFILKLLELVHKESIQKQAEVMDNNDDCKD